MEDLRTISVVTRLNTGHGKHARSRRLQRRHARLAVGAAPALGVFLFETYQEQTK
jgi:hypothetical protein